MIITVKTSLDLRITGLRSEQDEILKIAARHYSYKMQSMGPVMSTLKKFKIDPNRFEWFGKKT